VMGTQTVHFGVNEDGQLLLGVNEDAPGVVSRAKSLDVAMRVLFAQFLPGVPPPDGETVAVVVERDKNSITVEIKR
jgi:hypothetical protein